MELGRRNIVIGPKPGLLPEPVNDVQREERLATLWMAFLIDTGFSINSAWAPAMNYQDVFCAFPAALEDFASKVNNPLSYVHVIRC